MVKAYCGELVNKVMYDCQQFHGGFGYMQESVIERMVRDARVQSVGSGAPEVMLEEVAKRVYVPEQYQQPRYAGDGDGRRQHDGRRATNVDAVMLRDHVYQRAGG